MNLDFNRTIVAVSSGVAASRRAIIRISGSETGRILETLTSNSLPYKYATSFRGNLSTGWNGRRLGAQIYFWPNRRSFTGEPCAELHFLGSLPIVESLVEHIASLGAHPAQRGEFTLRSFLAGKIDLTQAEAVLGVIEADSPMELSNALQQLGGNISKPVRRLRDQLLELTAHLEAGLDFVEEDIEFISAEHLQRELTAIAEQLQTISNQLLSRSTRSRSAQVVLVGLPNSGKSSLFNSLVQSERSIVSSVAGTTRDAVTALMELGQLVIELVDTAGIEELSEDSARGLAQGVLEARLQRADVALLCIDLHAPPSEEWLKSQLERLRSTMPHVLLVGTKADLPHQSALTSLCDAIVNPAMADGLHRLTDRLTTTLRDSQHPLHSAAFQATTIRCRGSIDVARTALLRAQSLVINGAGEELVATELREAISDLSSVIGEIHTEDILGQIFSRFCIGK